MMLDSLPHHPLQEIQNDTSEYLCDGCKTHGICTGYRRSFFDFNLHECCATSTPTLASFLHPQHKLSPMVLTSYLNTTPLCSTCNFCGHEINEGLFYRCNICNFDMHPACTRLPEYINYHGHFIHPLRLELGPEEFCSTCFHVCTSWRYRCTCGFNIHLGCMSAPPSSPPPPIPSPFYAGTVWIPPSGYAGNGVPAANYAVYNNNPQQYVNAYQYASGSSGAVGIPPPGYAGIAVPAANYAVYNNYPQQYVNAPQYASGSSGALPSKGKRNFGKKVCSVVGRLAITIALGALGIPDVFFFL